MRGEVVLNTAKQCQHREPWQSECGFPFEDTQKWHHDGYSTQSNQSLSLCHGWECNTSTTNRLKARNPNPDSWVRSMKFELRFGDCSWSSKSKRTLTYPLARIIVERFPSPAKYSTHWISWHNAPIKIQSSMPELTNEVFWIGLIWSQCHPRPPWSHMWKWGEGCRGQTPDRGLQLGSPGRWIFRKKQANILAETKPHLWYVDPNNRVYIVCTCLDQLHWSLGGT